MRGVAKGLPKQPRSGEHYAAMPYSEVPAFMRLLEGKGDSVGRLAVRFTILTAARSGETRGATWGEIDLDARVWSIPANRMKAGQSHSVPLSDAAVDILRTMTGLVVGQNDELVFKGAGGKPLSDMTLTKALRDSGIKNDTVHGFRSSFRDWAAEQTSFPGEWAEAALAHVLSNKVEAAYRRTKFLDQRRKLMDAWADFLAGRSNVLRLAANG
jgi:integrase